MLLHFVNHLGENLSDSKIRAKLAKNSPYCANTINKVIKEKVMYGDFMDGPLPRTRLSKFDKLSLEQKDKIRFTVSETLFCC